MPTQTSARAHLQLQQGSNCTKSSLPTDLHIPVYDVNWKAAKSDSLIIASIVWSSAALSFVPCPEMTASYMSAMRVTLAQNVAIHVLLSIL